MVCIACVVYTDTCSLYSVYSGCIVFMVDFITLMVCILCIVGRHSLYTVVYAVIFLYSLYVSLSSVYVYVWF